QQHLQRVSVRGSLARPLILGAQYRISLSDKPSHSETAPLRRRRTLSAVLSGGSMFIRISWIPLCAIVLALGARADAQKANTVSRVGYLAAVSAAADAPRLKAFRQGLLDLGHVEGQNIIIEYRHESGGFERLPALAAELVGQ